MKLRSYLEESGARQFESTAVDHLRLYLPGMLKRSFVNSICRFQESRRLDCHTEAIALTVRVRIIEKWINFPTLSRFPHNEALGRHSVEHLKQLPATNAVLAEQGCLVKFLGNFSAKQIIC